MLILYLRETWTTVSIVCILLNYLNSYQNNNKKHFTFIIRKKTDIFLKGKISNHTGKAAVLARGPGGCRWMKDIKVSVIGLERERLRADRIKG